MINLSMSSLKNLVLQIQERLILIRTLMEVLQVNLMKILMI